VELVTNSFAAGQPCDDRPRLTAIIVNFESWPDTIRLAANLRSEPEFLSGQCQVVVVDNASSGPVPDFFLACPSGLRFIAREENDGFAAGVNAGWKAARSPWLLILNPDVEIAKGFLGQVFAQLTRYEAAPNGPPGIVGFGLRNPDGSPQGSVGGFPNLARTIWEQFIPRSRRKYQAGWRIRSGPVEWVTGACMLVNAATMEALRGMDEDFFLYYEEVALSRAAQRMGWRVEYDSSVHVVHRHPLQNRALSPRMRVITRHSKLLYFRKHLPRWQFLGLCQIVLAEAHVQGVRCRLKGTPEGARAWSVVREVARGLRRGAPLRGRDVLKLADSVALSDEGVRERERSGAALNLVAKPADPPGGGVASART
jgi:GT2 family glycosyltransferase